MHDDPIVLYIILRESLHLDNDKVIHCVADAVQHILLKYFMLQLLAVKTQLKSLENDDHIKITTKWLSAHADKTILTVDDETWDKLKTDFNLGKDLFCLKTVSSDHADIETTLVFWPIHASVTPTYLKL